MGVGDEPTDTLVTLFYWLVRFARTPDRRGGLVNSSLCLAPAPPPNCSSPHPSGRNPKGRVFSSPDSLSGQLTPLRRGLFYGINICMPAKDPYPWMYLGAPFDNPEAYEDHVGFVYLIEHLDTGKKYIGKKLLWSSGPKPTKRGVKRKRVESNWRSYYGSSTALADDIFAGKLTRVRREILRFCTSKGSLSYFEAQEQFARGVLLSDEYYNSIINCRIHANHVKGLRSSD